MADKKKYKVNRLEDNVILPKVKNFEYYLNEIRKFEEKSINVQVGDPFDEGSFGSLYSVRGDSTKCVKKSILSRNSRLDRVIASYSELKFYETVKFNSNLVRYFGHQIINISENEFELILEIELQEHGNLEEYIDNTPIQNVVIMKKLVRNMLEALKHMNDNCFFHRDLKPLNILLNKNNDFVLADFGLTVIYDKNEKNSFKALGQVGTTDFSAPEILDKKSYNRNSDVYSLGKIILYALTCKTSRSYIDCGGIEKFEQLAEATKLLRVKNFYPEGQGSIFDLLGLTLLRKESRPYAEDLLKHAFLKN